METLSNLRPLLDRHMGAVAVLALVATFVCRQIDLLVDLPPDLVSIAVIFPVVFTIASAHTRREDALKSFASLKAGAVALYLAHRDWPAAPHDMSAEGARLVQDLLSRVASYFKAPESVEKERHQEVYRAFDAISIAHRKMLNAGVTRTEVSRVSQYLREVMAEFERMRNFARYRTPITLRAFSRFFLSSFPILFAPYFAYVGYPEHPWIGYVVALIFSVVLVGLDNIQEQLENPYDGVGPDDLQLDVTEEIEAVLSRPVQVEA